VHANSWNSEEDWLRRFDCLIPDVNASNSVTGPGHFQILMSWCCGSVNMAIG
jgi:hypothetical protein